MQILRNSTVITGHGSRTFKKKLHFKLKQTESKPNQWQVIASTKHKTMLMFAFFIFVGVINLCLGYPEIEKPDCRALTDYGKQICNQESYDWCEWDNNYSVCDDTDEYDVDAVFISWYDNRINCFWIIFMCVIYTLIFLVSNHIGNYLLKKEIISQSYFEKCVIYIFEVLSVIPILYKFCYPMNILDPVFNPDRYRHPSPQLFLNLYSSVSYVSSSLCIMYMF